MNRETYFNAAIPLLNELFKEQGYELPPVNVSCSWPNGGGAKRIGECWPRELSEAGVNEIFISPVIDDSVKALDILVHELIHAIDNCEHGHRKEFTTIMKAIGLEGKPTATHAGERLHAQLQGVVELLGEYPHSKLNTAERKKQKSRQLKIECMDCTAVFRMSKKWQDQATICPCCGSENLERS